MPARDVLVLRVLHQDRISAMEDNAENNGEAEQHRHVEFDLLIG